MKKLRMCALVLAPLLLISALAQAEPLPNRGGITWQSTIKEVMETEREIDPENPPQHIELVTGKITSYVFREHALLLGEKADVLMYLFHNNELVQIHYDFYEENGGPRYQATLAKLKEMYGEPLSTDETESNDISNMLTEIQDLYVPELAQGYHEWMIDANTKLCIFYRENAFVISYTNYPWVLPYLHPGEGE